MVDPNNKEKDEDIRGRAGVAPIKAQFLIERQPTEAIGNTRSAPVDDDEAEGRGANDRDRGDKRQKTKKGWKSRTQNKRPERTGEAAFKLCKQWETTGECVRMQTPEGCKFQHSYDGYFEVKPQDIHFEHSAELQADQEPFVRNKETVLAGEDAIGKSIDITTECPVFRDLGYCTYGWRCRFLGGHVRKVEGQAQDVTHQGDMELIGREAKQSENPAMKHDEVNWPNQDVVFSLKKNQYNWGITAKYLHHIEPEKAFTLAMAKGSAPNPKNKKGKGKREPVKAEPVSEEANMNGDSEEAAMNATAEEEAGNKAANGQEAKPAQEPAAPAVSEEEAMNANLATEIAPKSEVRMAGVVDGEAEALDVPMRPEEKRRLNWENGLYLAPLTTVGNLPFRRLCVDYGATITISEMALAQPLVTGQSEEWALVRRHKSEKMFGVQLAGGYANRMVPAAEVLAKELGPSGVDFVDVNMGCPIDLIFKQGAGSALMDSPARLGKLLVGMNRALGEIPLSVKFRTGIAHTKPNAHKLIPRFATEWGVSAMSIHGRSRQQRYSKLANWDYIRDCVDTLKEACKDANMAPIPIFGNGDCFSAQSYYEEKEKSGVDGVMVARGALIKPWLFTEIAERREWDISATERLDGIRKFAEYGLSHWGSDTLGVNTTRRFLCEALSFQCRYVPIGLLERMPPMLNERPPPYHGRNELETLLSSNNVNDWIKISEMFLGPVDANFTFKPKHGSSSYGNEEAQG